MLQRSKGLCLLQPGDGSIKDEASEQLGQVRRERRANMQQLRRSMDEWARNMHQQAVSERAQVTYAVWRPSRTPHGLALLRAHRHANVPTYT